jgi:UDP-glucose 4-epimerase
MNILVVSCGFIGSNLADKLIEHGHKVIVINNLSAIVHKNFYFNTKAKYYEFDICDYQSTRPLYENVLSWVPKIKIKDYIKSNL